MSDWSYITLGYIVGWGGVAAYAVFLARRLFQARRLEQHLKEMASMDAPLEREPAWSGQPEGTMLRASVPGVPLTEGDRNPCDVPPAS